MKKVVAFLIFRYPFVIVFVVFLVTEYVAGLVLMQLYLQGYELTILIYIASSIEQRRKNKRLIFSVFFISVVSFNH